MRERRFLNLPNCEQKSLNIQFRKLFRAIDSLNGKKITNVNHVTISVFDHWLSFNESIELLSNIDSIAQAKYNEKLYNFVCLLTKGFECYLVRYKGLRKNIITFRKFTSNVARELTLQLKDYRDSDKHRFILVIPELNTIYCEGSDFTHEIFFGKGNQIKKINELLSIADLHTIEGACCK